MEKIVVTRHRNLVIYLKQLKLIDDTTVIYSYATKEDILGKHVIGKLPYFMSCHAGKYTEIQLRTPEKKKGKELDLDEIEFYAIGYKTYTVEEVDF